MTLPGMIKQPPKKPIAKRQKLFVIRLQPFIFAPLSGGFVYCSACYHAFGVINRTNKRFEVPSHTLSKAFTVHII